MMTEVTTIMADHYCTEAKTLGKLLAGMDNVKEDISEIKKSIAAMSESVKKIENHVFNGLTSNVQDNKNNISQVLAKLEQISPEKQPVTIPDPVIEKKEQPASKPISKSQKIMIGLGLATILIPNGAWIFDKIALLFSTVSEIFK